VLAMTDLLGRGGCCISGTIAGCGAAADRLLPRGRLLAYIVRVMGFIGIEMEWKDLEIHKMKAQYDCN
jgi:hypothetical protein